MMQHQLGFFGNIWVRQNILQFKGDTGGGHQHYFDHVTLLVKGKVRVETESHEPKEFTAPTFIVIRKEKEHKIIALEDEVIYYCVFALRDLNGEVVDSIYGPDNDPIEIDPKSANITEDAKHWNKLESM